MRRSQIKKSVTLFALLLPAALIQSPVAAEEANLVITPTSAEAQEFCDQASGVFVPLASGTASQWVTSEYGDSRFEYGYYCYSMDRVVGVYIIPESRLIDVINTSPQTTREAHGAATLYWDASRRRKTLVCGTTVVRYIWDPGGTFSVGGQTVTVPPGDLISEAAEIAMLNDAIRVWCPGGRPEFVPSRSVTFANVFDDLLRFSDYGPSDADTLRLYQAFFRREPEFGGAQYWLEQIRSGTSLDSIADTFAASEEFQLTYGDTTDEEFLRIVYRNVLGRYYDQAGFDYWLGLLRTGLSRGATVRWVAASDGFTGLYPYAPLP